ncbi:hypothetical protein BB560_001020 [Smittium megazygosporum]|uniref:SEC7 domain-containing protein n=1 Tax=Smittium megazygosporum TaxID=133381 RepID=A0A2T9ZIZ3_9FUNG|nr:hypothetical protein BB560_001020 [Smittium megazygosporum]
MAVENNTSKSIPTENNEPSIDENLSLQVPSLEISEEDPSESNQVESPSASENQEGLPSNSDQGTSFGESPSVNHHAEPDDNIESAEEDSKELGSGNSQTQETGSHPPPSPGAAPTSSSNLIFALNSIKTLMKSKDANKESMPLLEKGLDLLQKKVDDPAAEENKYLDWNEAITLIEALELMSDPLTKNTGTIEIVIDMIEKLVSFECLKKLGFQMKRARSHPPQSDLKNHSADFDLSKKVWKTPLSDYSDRLVKIVCKSFTGSTTSASLQLQIVKATLTMIISPDLEIHQDSLLRAVRTVVNIYLLSSSTPNEAVAQTTLLQIIRVTCKRASVYASDLDIPISVISPEEKEPGEHAHQETDINHTYDDQYLVSDAAKDQDDLDLNDIKTRDVFLVFWALSKLSMRKMDETSPVLKSFSERSRSLALFLMYTMLKEYHSIFVNSFLFVKSDMNKDSRSNDIIGVNTSFTNTPNSLTNPNFTRNSSENFENYNLDTAQDVDGASQELQAAVETALKETPNLAKNPGSEPPSITTNQENYYTIPLIIVVKQYLSLSLSRNLVSTNLSILSISILILELVLVYIRSYLKQEIEVLMKEIVFPILSMKHTGSLRQRLLFVRMFSRVFRNPSLVVELYLNYDCDPNSSIQIFQQITEHLCKICGAKVNFSSSSVRTGMWDGWSNMNQTQQDSTEEHLWMSIQDANSVFRAGSSTFISGIEESRESSSDHNINSSLDLDHFIIASDPDPKRKSLPPTHTANYDSERASSPQTRSFSNLLLVDGNPLLKPNLNQEGDEYTLRQISLNCLCYLLQSMVIWSNQAHFSPSASASIEKLVNEESTKEGGEINFNTKAKPYDKSKLYNNVSLSRSVSNNTRHIEVTTFQSQDDANISQINAIKERKEKLARYIKLFNWKPKNGIKELIREGFIESESPSDVAEFLVKNSKEGLINKVTLGEYLGGGDIYNIEVMHKFVDLLIFRKMSFTGALRLFLQNFRLPGEGQKIDRFMLKFAERYIEDNKETNVFSNAGTAYVLAYSTIMLNTDLHNPQIRSRMTKEGFIINNRGIDNGEDIPREILEAIYDEISADEIKLKDDPLESQTMSPDQNTSTSDGSSFFFELWKRGRSNDKLLHSMSEHSAKMASSSERKIRAITKLQEKKNSGSRFWFLDKSNYTRASRVEHVSSMFSTMWPPVLAALSLPLQTTRDPRVIFACLISLQSCIALACRFRLTLERAAFINTLTKFTILGGMEKISYKHAEATRSLLEVPLISPDVGEGFEEDWIHILQCISLVDRLQLLLEPTSAADPKNSLEHSPKISTQKTNTDSDSYDQPRNTPNPNKASQERTKAGHAKGKRDFNNSQSNAALISVSKERFSKLEPYLHTLDLIVDKIFSYSVLLSGQGIVDFVKALTHVAFEEIDINSPGSGNTAILELVPKGLERELRHKNLKPTRSKNGLNLQNNLHAETLPPSISSLEADNLSVNDGSINSELNTPNVNGTHKISSPGLPHQRHSLNYSNFGLSQSDQSFLRITNSLPVLKSSSRLCMLTRIIEIVYYNMNRVKFEWSNIWAILGDLFDRAGSYPDTRVAEYTLDSLRQLSNKFLELDELPHFQFQRQFLRPFVTVLEYQSSLVIASNGQTANVGDRFVKDMVLNCIKQIIETKSSKLKSGWRSVLMVSQIAADDDEDKIAEMGFKLSKMSCESLMSMLVDSKRVQDHNDNEKFCELLNCLSAYALNSNRLRISLQAIDQLFYTAQFIKIPLENNSDTENFMEFYLRSLFENLHQIVLCSDDLEIRSHALERCYAVATLKAKEMTPELWKYFFENIAFALFAEVKDGTILSSKNSNADEVELWISTTLLKALRLMVGLFSFGFENEIDLNVFIREFLVLLNSCICLDNETLSRIGAASMQDFVERGYKYFSTEIKSEITQLIASLLEQSRPELLFKLGSKIQYDESTVGDSDELYFKITMKCVLQLQLISSIADIFISPSFSTRLSQYENPLYSEDIGAQQAEQAEEMTLFGLRTGLPFRRSPIINYFSHRDLMQIFDSLDQSRVFAHKFNSNLSLRRRLVERGITPQLPSLLRQETNSSLIELLLLESLYCQYISGLRAGTEKAKNKDPHVYAPSKREIKEFFKELDDRLIPIFQEIVFSYNFSAVPRKENRENYQSYIPWPRNMESKLLFSLSVYRETGFSSTNAATAEKKENSANVEDNSAFENIENAEQKQTETSNTAAEQISNPDENHEQEAEVKENENAAPVKQDKLIRKSKSISISENPSEANEKDTNTEGVVNPAKRESKLVGGQFSGFETDDMGDVVAISDSHRMAWRKCLLTLVTCLGRIYLHDVNIFKKLIKPIYNEIIKSLSMAFNTNDNVCIGHLQFLLACTSSAYGISEQELHFL